MPGQFQGYYLKNPDFEYKMYIYFNFPINSGFCFIDPGIISFTHTRIIIDQYKYCTTIRITKNVQKWKWQNRGNIRQKNVKNSDLWTLIKPGIFPNHYCDNVKILLIFFFRSVNIILLRQTITTTADA